MDTKQVLQILNKALQIEYAAAIQYLQHSNLVQGIDRKVYADFFRHQSQRSMDHARQVGGEQHPRFQWFDEEGPGLGRGPPAKRPPALGRHPIEAALPHGPPRPAALPLDRGLRHPLPARAPRRRGGPRGAARASP